ncbi:uncharacterized protein J3R85_021208, partial [Psidium guajava]
VRQRIGPLQNLQGLETRTEDGRFNLSAVKRRGGKNQINLCHSTLLPIILTRFQAVAECKVPHLETVQNTPISTTKLGAKLPQKAAW